jgi:formate dehydrogenase major subunit
MPANEIEIEEAEEEGVVFEYLAAPIGIALTATAEPAGGMGAAGGRNDVGPLEVECIRMELGKPDESGRRRPVPIENSNYRLKVDIVITAVGQGPDLNCIDDRSLVTARETLKTNRESGTTADDFVFAGGDCVTGAATAIEAVAAGRTAAESIDLFLRTGVKRERPGSEFNISKGTVEEMAAEFFAHYQKAPRAAMPALKPDQRVKGFQEIEAGLSEAQARAESARCLECGCAQGYSCALRDNSTRFAVKTEDFTAPKRVSTEWYNDIVRHRPISKEESKCIKCGICVRICDEVWGLHIYGFMLRGSDTIVQPPFGRSLAETECDFCGQCADACPTGALSLGTYLPKPGPFKVEKQEGICLHCSLGCSVEYNLYDGELVQVTSSPCLGENEGNLCIRGRFGYDYLTKAERVVDHMVFDAVAPGKVISSETAVEESVKLLKKARRPAFVTSSQLSNEEFEAVRDLAAKLPGSRVFHLCHDFGEGANGGAGVPLSAGTPPISAGGDTISSGGIPIAGKSRLFEKLLEGVTAPSLADIGANSTILLFAVSPGRHYPILEMHIRRAAQRGTKLYILHDSPLRLDDHADGVFRLKGASAGGGDAEKFINLLARGVELRSGRSASGSTAENRKTSAECLSRVRVKPEKVKALVEALAGTGKVLFVADENEAGPEALKSFIRLAKSCGDRAELLLMGRGMNAWGITLGVGESSGERSPVAASVSSRTAGRRPAGGPDGWYFSGGLIGGSDVLVLFKTPRLSDLPSAPVIHIGFKPFTRYGGRAFFVPSSSLLETGGSTTIYNGKRVGISPILRNVRRLDNLDFLGGVARGLSNVR